MARKYEKLVYQFTPEYNDIQLEGIGSDFVYSPQAYFRGGSQIPGAQYNVGFQIVVKPYFLDRFPHTHDVDEYLIYIGGTFPNVFEFDAEISLFMGEEMEEYIITQPTIVRIPAGVLHCPMEFRKVNKPVFFQAACMQGMFGSVVGEGENRREMFYNGPIQCVLDQSKRCNSCRECLKLDWNTPD